MCFNDAHATYSWFRMPDPGPVPPRILHLAVQHHHHQHIHQGPCQVDCCLWLNKVDGQCVCDLLAHLPSFLAKLVHEHHVVVPDTCDVTYSCGGRPRQ
ncbi:hypothetical protein MLD38_021623 [Melastoma candidum]|uniref:Uncharacterized protein n=1 Tax=Melastoma candidum TaxID=119954 RepID=A0ACB9QFW2_9MYRT|nr:hypothetical protein MLD38_021623 [Melastoma candidum]